MLKFIYPRRFCFLGILFAGKLIVFPPGRPARDIAKEWVPNKNQPVCAYQNPAIAQGYRVSRKIVTPLAQRKSNHGHKIRKLTQYYVVSGGCFFLGEYKQDRRETPPMRSFARHFYVNISLLGLLYRCNSRKPNCEKGGLLELSRFRSRKVTQIEPMKNETLSWARKSAHL